MELTLRRGLGTTFLNTVRASSFLVCPTPRPIGFKIGETSNLIATSDSTVEDMTTFISNVASVDYSYSGERELIIANCTCDGALTVAQLLEGTGIKPLDDREVLHSLAPVNVTVAFRFTGGYFLDVDNLAVLQEHGYVGMAAINSRHCAIRRFDYRFVSKIGDSDLWEINIETVDGRPPEAVLGKALEEVSATVKAMAKSAGLVGSVQLDL